jgi:hypothetical protein
VRRRPPLAAAALAAFVVGVAVLVPFDAGVTLFAGVALLFASVVLGVFAIASPEYLARAPDDDERPRRPRA